MSDDQLLERCGRAALVLAQLVLAVSLASHDLLAPTRPPLKTMCSSARAAPDTRWRVAGIDDPARFVAWFRQVQDWVRRDDAESLAQVISFPLTGVRTPEEFQRRYHEIVGLEVKSAILGTDPDDLGLCIHGVMVDRGRVWFRQESERSFVIGAINRERGATGRTRVPSADGAEASTRGAAHLGVSPRRDSGDADRFHTGAELQLRPTQTEE